MTLATTYPGIIIGIMLSVLASLVFAGVAPPLSELPLATPNVTPVARQRDIVVVVLDDMRTSDWVALPQTQALLMSDGGTWLPNYIMTTPRCCPSRATMFTGMYAHNHGVLANGGPNGGIKTFRENGWHAVNVATTLHRHGYATALYGKYMNGWDHDKPKPPGWDDWWGWTGIPGHINDRLATDVIADKAGKFARSVHPDQPLLMWLAPYAPHGPSTYPRRHQYAFPEAEGRDRDRLRSLLAVDDMIVSVANDMGERWADACVIVADDNGYILDGRDSGKNVPIDEVLRVPMLARCDLPTTGTDTRLVGNIDLAPTMADVAGVELPWEVDGRSLLDPWRRQGILVEGWPGGLATDEWKGIQTETDLYVKWSGLPAVALTPDGQATTLPDTFDVWLDLFDDCAGNVCRIADGA